MKNRRNTQLRQGSVLSDQCAICAGILTSSDVQNNKKVIIISHDCDLPSETETHVEYIVGNIITKADGLFINARHVRQLHLDFGNDVILALHIRDKCQIEKTESIMAMSCDAALVLSETNKTTLKHWLAARYARPAYPDKFEELLSKELEKKIAKTLTNVSQHVIGIYFDLGQHRHFDLPDGEPYCLKISVVYNSLEGAEKARKEAETLASNIESHFFAIYKKPNEATQIALESCKAVAEMNFTIADLRRTDQWRVEYISYRQGNTEDVITMGE